jgi:hypothetical protein
MELHNLYSSPNIIRKIKLRRMRWTGHVAQMRTRRNAYRILVGKPKGKRPPERPRRSEWIILKLILDKIGWDGMEWIDLAQDRDKWRALVSTVINFP